MANATYKNATTYEVRLTALATVGPLKYQPAGSYEMTGKMVNRIIAENGEAIIDRATAKP